MNKIKKNSTIEQKQFGDNFYFLIAFIEGFLIMSTELLATNLISPHFGQSLSVITIVLGVTMFALASGYLFGSKLSTYKNLFNYILVLSFLFMISFLFMPFLSKALFRSYLDENLIKTLLICVVPFLFTPLFFLSSLSPILVKVINENSKEVGFNSSRVFTWSTIGGIISCIVLALILIEFLSVITIFYLLFLGLSIFLYFGLSKFKMNSSKYILLVIFGLSSLFFFGSKDYFKEPLPSSYQEIYYSDGVLGQIKIIENTKEKTRSLYTNNTIQTFSMINGQNVWEYIDRISKVINFKPGTTLLAGLGGGVLINNIKEIQKSIDVVDIDSRMFEIANTIYNINETEQINFITDDIRHYIRLCKKKYDYIILDLSASENVPSHVYTLESFKEMRKKLNENGLIIIHYFSDFKSKGKQSIDAIGNTLLKANYTIRIIPTEKKKDELSSVVYVAFKNKMNDFEKFPFEKLEIKNDIILTDDKPILDLLRKDMVFFTRKDFIKGYHQNWQEINQLN
jgi:predicted membrane-bound spermidine synthase